MTRPDSPFGKLTRARPPAPVISLSTGWLRLPLSKRVRMSMGKPSTGLPVAASTTVSVNSDLTGSSGGKEAALGADGGGGGSSAMLARLEKPAADRPATSRRDAASFMAFMSVILLIVIRARRK